MGRPKHTKEKTQIFAKNFSRMCKEKNLTGVYLAQKLNVASASITYWQQGKKLPSIEHLLEIATLLAVSIESLFEEKGGD